MGRIALNLAGLMTPACASAERSGAVTPVAPVVANVDPAKKPRGSPTRWLKGQTHAHSNNSADGHTPPTDVVDWYRRRDFDFLVLTDHNFNTTLSNTTGAMLVFSGAELRWNASECGPPDPDCHLHLNALFTSSSPPNAQLVLYPNNPLSRQSIYENELATTNALHGIAQLNHPNFHYGANADLLVTLAKQGLRLVEFSNASSGVQNEGDRKHPSTEELWNQALNQGADLWNVASDDAHDFNDADTRRAEGSEVFTGNRGWIMVRAQPTLESIRAAVLEGRFYATTGPTIQEIEVSDHSYTVSLLHPTDKVSFIVSPGETIEPKSGKITTLDFSTLRHDVTWVRAIVDNTRGHRAWTQPVRISRDGGNTQAIGPFARAPAPQPASLPALPNPRFSEPMPLWDTDSESIRERGGGKIQMKGDDRNGSFKLYYGDGSFVTCERRGDRCEGTWRGGNGKGWISITLSADQQSFSGEWGYEDNRLERARFSGKRRSSGGPKK
ncbi:MAG: hypothetical protein U0165_16315 [Polyangiaceae bacterium]